MIVRQLLMLFLGFSSGLPLYVTLDMLKAWLVDEKVALAVIGVTNILGIPYNLKFLWAPLVDRFTLLPLGRRRSWMLISQLGLVGAIASVGLCKPAEQPWLLGGLCLLVNVLSATQDIVIDAFRRDILPERELGLGSSIFIAGYRIGMLVSGALALWLAETLPWSTVYQIIAACMLVGVGTTLCLREPVLLDEAPRSLRAAVVEPFKHFLSRREAWLLLLFVLTYKIGESFASAMTIPFYRDIGFSKAEIASVAKTVGLIALILGGLVGGAILLRLGRGRALFYFGILQAAGILGFWFLGVSALQSWFPGWRLELLAVAIGAENFAIGMAGSAFVAAMSALCDRRFSATQYALLSSVSGLPRTVLSTPAGWLAAQLGWVSYFAVCALVGSLALCLVLKLMPLFKEESIG